MKILTENAQQYVAFGEDLYGDRLTARNLNENLFPLSMLKSKYFDHYF